MNRRKRTIRTTAAALAAAAILLSATIFAASAPAHAQPTADIQAACAEYSPKFDELAAWLDTRPSLSENQDERESKLKLIDDALLYPEAKLMPCAADFLRRRMEAFIADFEASTVSSGAVIWKLYNHTVIIQTPETAIAVDLIQGPGIVRTPREIIERIVARTDILLVTHHHGDHVDWDVWDMYLDAGKKVVVPEPARKEYRRRDELTVIRQGKIELPGVLATVFPSYQKKDLCSSYLIKTKDGVSAMHLGDENNIMRLGSEWYRKIKPPMEIDVLIPNIWCPNLKPLLDYIKPALILPGHEHEIGHPVEGRRPYSYVYRVLRAVGLPYAVPAWGERVAVPAPLPR